ncbi:hypothetical protein KRX19_07020 [Cardiobacteriaceae bacterium TAE3-ERU3]|nr:hypothetical protein [Cardiobacteriaceae bacterium TAE3-ERU3]
MKSWMIMMAAAGVAMAGCSSEPDFPKECEEVADMVKDMGKDAPAGQMEQFEKQMEQSREQWKTLSKEQREQAKQQCIAAKDQMKQMKDMLDQMQKK